MTIIEAKLINCKDASYGEGSSRVERYKLTVQNENATNSYESELTVIVPKELAVKSKLDNEKFVDSVRSKKVRLMGVLFDKSSQGFDKEKGTPFTTLSTKFKVLDIAFVEVK